MVDQQQNQDAGFLIGFDASKYQKTINWDEAKAAGATFAFIKATEGNNGKDPFFDRNWDEAKRIGIVRGAYHFFRQNADPIAQAKNFLLVVGALDDGDLPFVVDWETDDGVDKKSQPQNVKAFLEYVQANGKRKPIIYSYLGFINSLGLNSQWSLYELWLAAYRSQIANAPSPWTKYSFWQDSDAYKVDADLTCDGDRFLGTAQDLSALIERSKV